MDARGDLTRRGEGSASTRRASRTRSSSSTPPRATSSLYTQGDFTDLCRGPHLQNSKPIKALKLTGLAGAYWRGDSTKPQLTRIYGTAFYSQEDLDAYLERLEEARKRDHRVLGAAARPLPPVGALARLAVLAPEGDGDLERARGSAPPREPRARLPRGEDAAHLRRRRSGSTSGHWEKYRREHVPHPARATTRSTGSSR